MKILIVDDHPILRQGLAALLVQVAEGTSISQAHDVEEAFAIVGREPDIDAVILDLRMPGIGGMQAISEFGRRRPDLPVIVLSSSEDVRDARQALALGALGYVPKSASQHVLLSAVRLVLDGQVYIPQLLLGDVTGRDQVPASSANGSAPSLTERQVQILNLLSTGQPNKTIARTLGLSEKTVKVHITAIFKALRVVNRTQAAAAGRASNLI